MATSRVCQTCGSVLTPDASPAGLCPSCLFAQALSAAPDLEPAGEIDSTDLPPGAVFGPFLIEGVLGHGGMSTVYRAIESALNRVVALKILPPEFLHDPDFARRFQHEARIAAALEHSRIVPLYASGIEDGIPWMSMRLMPGGTLEGLIGDGLHSEQAIEVLRDVAAGLDYAHARGVVHRDVKPSNVLLDGTGHACIGDFGLAHLTTGSMVRTRTGVIAGTPRYMAPEQGLGKRVDHRSDLYSLGIVAYELLTGGPPFDAESPVALLMKHATDPMPVPSGQHVPSRAVPVLRKALAKAPGERWPTAAAFVTTLEASLTARTSARPVRRSVAWGAGLGLVTILGLFSLVPSPTPPPVQHVPMTPSALAPRAPSDAAPGAEPSSPVQPEVAPPAAGTGVSRPPTRGIAKEVSRPAPGQPAPSRSESLDTRQPAPATPAGSDSAATDVSAAADRANLPEPPVAKPPSGSTTATAAARSGLAPPATVSSSPPTIVEPQRVRTVKPTYPELARAAQIEGDVLLEAVVGPEGRVTDVRVLRSVHPLLDRAARDAVLQYEYRPGLRNGVPEPARVQLTVSFRLQ